MRTKSKFESDYSRWDYWVIVAAKFVTEHEDLKAPCLPPSIIVVIINTGVMCIHRKSMNAAQGYCRSKIHPRPKLPAPR